MKAAAANADKAVEDWKMSVLEREYLDNVQEERVTLLVSEIAKIQKEGSLAESATDINYHTARKIEKEVENFYYEMITRRMSANRRLFLWQVIHTFIYLTSSLTSLIRLS